MRRLTRPPFLAGVLLTACGTAGGAQIALAAERAEAAEGPASKEHSVGIYARTNGAVALTPARTAGGAGGGLGVRDVFRDWLILQADVAYLFGIGNLGELRAGAGIQLPGPDQTYQPAASLLVSLYFGEQLRFLSEEHPRPVWDPAVALGVELSPLRFTSERTRISVMAPGLGLVLDVPTVGPVVQLTALEVEILLP